MRKILKKDFFERSAVKVARDLLGKHLVRKVGGKTAIYLITETEAYEGPDDLASHASKGRTKRTELMFGEAGRFYVYLVYGMYHMLNVVTGAESHPGAVLIRGVENISGPGRLTKALSIGMELNGKKSCVATGLWFKDCPFFRGREFLDNPKYGSIKNIKRKIFTTPRIGVAYAGPVWSKKLWRFVYSE